MGMRTEPFIYGVKENNQYKGHRCPPQAVKGEEIPVIGMLDDNRAFDTDGAFKPLPVAEAEEESTQEPVVEPTQEPEPVVEPTQDPVQEPETQTEP